MLKKITVLTMTIFFCILGLASAASPEYRTISVTGQSEMKVKADKATISVSVESFGKDSQIASQTNNKIVRKIQQQLTILGVTDIKTTNYTLYPRYNEKNSNQIDGYVVNDEISLTITDLSKISQVIDTAIKNGATNIDSIEFGLSNPALYRDKVTTEAVRNAQDKAKLLANLLGKEVVNVVSVSSSYNDYPQTRAYSSFMKADAAISEATPIEAGMITLRSNVNIVFQMND